MLLGGLLGVTNYESAVRVEKILVLTWQIQYGAADSKWSLKIEKKMQNTIFLHKTNYPGNFGVTDLESAVKDDEFLNLTCFAFFFNFINMNKNIQAENIMIKNGLKLTKR